MAELPSETKISENLIREQHERGIKPGKRGKSSKDDHFLTKIPDHWRRVELQGLALQITDGTHLTPKYTESGMPFLSAKNVKPFAFLPDEHRFVSLQDFESYRSNRKPERGDILLTRVGAGIGEAAVIDTDFEFAIYVSVCLIKPLSRYLDPEYLCVWLNSPEGRSFTTERTYGRGASQGNLNLEFIRTLPIPLPPLSEQQGIVKRARQLFSLYDEVRGAIARRSEHEVMIADSLTSRVH